VERLHRDAKKTTTEQERVVEAAGEKRDEIKWTVFTLRTERVSTVTSTA